MSFKQLFDPNSSTFTYFIIDDTTHETVLIDPVIEQVERDLQFLREHGLQLKYVLETHIHADHITAGLAIKQATGAQTAVGRDCLAQGYDRSLQDGDVILFGKEEILVIATPGHTAGSVSFLWRDRVFTGDALLIGGCGRTDFQNGNPETLYRSITEKLFTLDDQVLVYPAHDYKGRRVSSIGEEKEFNARVTGKTLDEFVAIMNNLNLPMPKHIQEAVPANLIGGDGLKNLSKPLDKNLLETKISKVQSVSAPQLAALKESGNVQIIDVRTPAEFASLHIAGSFNIPFENLNAAQLMANFSADTPIYCLCQTGTRSQIAADRLRAAGFRHVVHVDGGTNAWESSGFPLERGAHSVMSLERQVRIAAGGLILLGVLAGIFIRPMGYAISGLIGAGLLYSGVTNSCGMAMVMAKMPWNKRSSIRKIS
jgi:glyoxylase-like metal-dependent hydrolase (beta-lactamase superfamily II)/rhodanese-related sulfurtransferase